MLNIQNKTERKYFIMELCFLLFMGYGISIISDLEYSYYEQHNIARFTDAFEYRLVYGTFAFVFYAFYYWAILKGLVFNKKIIPILLCIVGFVFAVHIYDIKVVNWLVSHSAFLSADIRKRALRDFNQQRLYFTVNYVFISEIIPFTGFAFLIRSLTQDDQMKTLKEQQLVSELNYLKAQLHPHFFFNTINNIYALALKQSTDTAPMVAKLGEMMRYILYHADKKTVPLSREIQFLTDYISVEKIRHRATDQIQFDVQGNTEDVHLEPLLLLPFIENAFKHGLEEETTGGFVSIVICLTEDELVLEVKNSKPVSAANNSSGIGLQNVQKRLNILYPGKHQLDIGDSPERYSATLTLQLI